MELIAEFLSYGRAYVQKNNLEIRKKGKARFISHSNDFKIYRDELSTTLRDQYEDQGYDDPIDFPVEIHFKYYVAKKGVADVDNLPGAFCDACQGIKTGRKKTDRTHQILLDDRLIYKIIVERFIEGEPGYHGQPRLEAKMYKYKTEVIDD